MNTYDQTYEAIVLMAKAKMIMNSHKGDIESLPANTLLALAKAELAEVEEAVTSGSSQVHIIEECADLMNYLVALAHVAKKR